MTALEVAEESLDPRIHDWNALAESLTPGSPAPEHKAETCRSAGDGRAEPSAELGRHSGPRTGGTCPCPGKTGCDVSHEGITF